MAVWCRARARPRWGGGVTEADAWRDFWDTMLANWRPPNETTQWWRVRTIRVRDLFG
jgi:hypothetical protein